MPGMPLSEPPLVRRGVDEGHERARFAGREHFRPLDRRLDGRADQPHLLAIEIGQELAAREHVVGVLEVAPLVVAEPAHGEDGGGPACAGRCQRQPDHRMGVAGNHLVGGNRIQHLFEQPLVLSRLAAMRPRFVVVAGH